MLGKLAGEKTISGIRDWIEERKQDLKEQRNWPKRFPVQSTYDEALAKCSGEEIAQVILKARAVEKCGEEPSRLLNQESAAEKLIHTALDGKTLRGTLGHAKEGQPPEHLLSLDECQSGMDLTQRAVKSKENEMTAAGALFHPLSMEVFLH